MTINLSSDHGYFLSRVKQFKNYNDLILMNFKNVKRKGFELTFQSHDFGHKLMSQTFT